MSSPGATSPQRDSASQRLSDADLAHERAVLVPGAADGRLGLAQRRLLHGDQRGLAEVARDQRRDAGGLEQLEHVEAQHGRVDRQHAAALLDPRPLVDRAEARVRRELLVPARGGPGVRLGPLALVEGPVDRLRERQRRVARHEPAHEQAAVAQDARAQQLGGEVRAAMSGSPSAAGRRSKRGRGVLGIGRRAVEQADAGEVAEASAAGARWPGRGPARLASVRRPISASSSSVVPSNSAAGGGSATAAPPRDPCRGRRRRQHARHGTEGVRPRAAPARRRPSRPAGRRRPRPRSPRRPRPPRSGPAPITLAPVPMLTSRSIVAPWTSPARRPIVTNGAITAPGWISTSPSITTWPWIT